MTTTTNAQLLADAYTIEVNDPTAAPRSSELADPTPLQLDAEETVLPASEQDSDEVTASTNILQAVLDLVNAERARVGLAPLRLHSQLMSAAQAHSGDMARHQFMDHRGSDGSSPFDRMRRYGYNFRYAGENVASGYNSAQAVMQGWMNSSGHRANILNPNFRDIGIGYTVSNQPYWTQKFGS